jgi:hypothetical protein
MVIILVGTVTAQKNPIENSYEKESAVSLIKKFVTHFWNPEMGYLNKQLQCTSLLWTMS